MKDNNRKKNILLTAVLLLIIAIIAAVLIIISLNIQNKTNSPVPDYSADDVAVKVIGKMNYKNLIPISSENISKYYDVPKGLVSDSAMYISNRSDTGTEVACFKLENSNDEKKLLGIISEYTSSKISNYKNVNDTSVQSRTDVIYPYVFVVISSDTDNAVTAFQNVIQTDNDD